MVSKKFKVLEVIDNQEYIFNTVGFKTSIQRYVTTRNAAGEKLTVQSVKEDLADKICVSTEAISNWMYGKNGVSDLQIVMMLAEFLETDYRNLLKMSEVVAMEKNVDVINDKFVKDYIRPVYDKLCTFMQAAVENAEHHFEQDYQKMCEDNYNEVIKALRQNMLDIPESVYDRVSEILEYEYRANICLFELEPTKVLSDEYIWFIEEANELEHNEQSMKKFMEYREVEFYKDLREALQLYIPA